MNKRLSRLLHPEGWRALFGHVLPQLWYPHYYRTLPLDEKAVLLESQHGTGMNGNIYYLLRVLATDPRYREFTLYLACRDDNRDRFQTRLEAEGMTQVRLVAVHSRAYLRVLASAKYLFGDITFYPLFVKRPDQVYLNTWHGTPLKTLGRRVNNDLHNIAGVQKNFFMADYLLYPNAYTMEHMVEDYMLPGLSHARILLAGYPRNTAFFDVEDAVKQREQLGLLGKRVYAFLPTWRGQIGAIDPNASADVQRQLQQLDEGLTEDEVLFVNLHPMAKKDVSFADFDHVRPFPVDRETYRFLNVADCLITDYSSVFYDFAVTRKKCVLFTYDEEAYEADRGFYRPLSTLPFPRVKTVEALLSEIRSPKQYDDKAFLREYCPYDRPDAAVRLCERVIFGQESDAIQERPLPDNGRPNVLLYAGDLARNGITTSLLNLLSHTDFSARNYYVTFRTKAVAPHREVLHRLPAGVNYIATDGRMGLGLWKTLAQKLFYKRLLPLSAYRRLMEKEYPWEIRRCYGDAPFSDVVQFCGYETERTLFFAAFPANRVIYVHNDMQQEIRTRKNQRRDVLQYAYGAYDHVAMVTEDLQDPTAGLLAQERPLEVAHNLIDYRGILARGDQCLSFDEKTRSTHTLEQLQALLDEPGKCLVNVGRFSPEKGHRRLIDTFVRVWQEMPDSALVIIGGNQWGGLYDELCAYAATLPCADRIVLILSMENPLPLVKACDGFVLSSYYEGFGLVLAEADILGLPVISTAITGPSGFMRRWGGTLVEDSEAGIEEGLRRLLRGEIPRLTVDYEAYNRQAVAEFAALLKKEEV